MMNLFKSKYETELNGLIEKIEVNCSNNYKDAAQECLRDYENRLNELIELKLLNNKKIDVYKQKLDVYKQKLKGFTHKDQKPFWT